MKCVWCTTEMDSIKASFQSKWGEYEVTIDGVKAYQCKQCQRFVFEPEVVSMIQNITAIVPPLNYASDLMKIRPSSGPTSNVCDCSPVVISV